MDTAVTPGAAPNPSRAGIPSAADTMAPPLGLSPDAATRTARIVPSASLTRYRNKSPAPVPPAYDARRTLPPAMSASVGRPPSSSTRTDEVNTTIAVTVSPSVHTPSGPASCMTSAFHTDGTGTGVSFATGAPENAATLRPRRSRSPAMPSGGA